MSSSFSANQYDSAFQSKRLQNWCEAKSFKERPSKHVGHTSFVADSRGHLLPGVKKGSAWPDFKGTWDLPSRIPAHHINKTARSAEGLIRLESWGFGQPKKGKSLSDRGSRITDVGEQELKPNQSLRSAPSLGVRATS
ncbi:protein Flattop isoform X2 [Girardinichthys multiradiatus]|uniref:protein Flattop isoform X2 n=1 Tax=Girardinichthys multiradiatus TaxID=208333 RepID=UPI001FAC85BE|nr:protein Flattop isoform X2 [Girardinichthys multiradiatus]